MNNKFPRTRLLHYLQGSICKSKPYKDTLKHEKNFIKISWNRDTQPNLTEYTINDKQLAVDMKWA